MMKDMNNPTCRLKKSTVALLNELTSLVGKKSWQRVSQACTGKWRGTTDYGVLFDDGLDYWISNGMTFFEDKIKDTINEIHTITTNRDEYLRILRQQAERDNQTAASKGLLPVEVLDIGIESQSKTYFLWTYVTLKVGGARTFKFTETGLYYDMKNNNMQQWIECCKRELFTAGAVKKPDYIFGNVRFSSTDDLYKINPHSHH